MSSWHSNTDPRDQNGEVLEAGISYFVSLRGQVKLCHLFEADGYLWAKFETPDGNERPQRVDELSQFCEWERITEETA